MRFKKEVPKQNGYYWYQKHPSYAATIGHLLTYGIGSGKEGQRFVIPFGGTDIWEDCSLTGTELWGSRIKEP